MDQTARAIGRKYLIKEIFGPTLQGEGSAAGTPVYFVRFSSCNRWTGRESDRHLAFCTFCDTDFFGGVRMAASDIIDGLSRIRVENVSTIIISGGEPTLQLDRALCEALKYEGFKLHLETNGSHDIETYADLIDHVSMSPKQSLEETKLRSSTDLKLLYPWIHPKINAGTFQNFSTKNRFIQPVYGPEYELNLKASILALSANQDLKDYRLSLQLHKVVGIQ